MIATALSTFGENSQVIWEFGAGVLAVMLTAALIVMGIALIKRFIDM